MRPLRKMRYLPLVAATFFMVSGGPYAIEDILGGAGYFKAILILALLPLIWSLPTALMIGELASALPYEGGFYVWVRRALGPFWGFQEAWLSLAASIFDMAIYPTTFVLYIGYLAPSLGSGHRGWLVALLVVAVCCVWNLKGAPAVGDGSLALSILLLAPFAVLVVLGFMRGAVTKVAVDWNHASSHEVLSTAILVAMWNYMGWDNASTIAQEVEDPRRTYPRAMLASTAIVTVSYLLPLAAVAVAGIPASGFSTGAWTEAGRTLGGPLLAIAIVIGGTISGLGMMNALVLSYTRLPFVLAQEGLLPRALARCNRFGVPWVSVLVCSLGWALALGLNFERLISMDLVLYGCSLLLEFIALVVLRIKEPKLNRPFRAGSLAFASLLGVGPAALIIYAAYSSRNEQVGHLPAVSVAACIALCGPLVYWLAIRKNRTRSVALEQGEPMSS